MRIFEAVFACLAATLLTACERKAADIPAANDDRVACQPAGAERFEAVCGLERQMTERGLMLTIRHPDGGFRRLLVVKDGRGVIAADGAEQAVVKLVDAPAGTNDIEVALGGDRYLLPATVKAGK